MGILRHMWELPHLRRMHAYAAPLTRLGEEGGAKGVCVGWRFEGCGFCERMPKRHRYLRASLDSPCGWGGTTNRLSVRVPPPRLSIGKPTCQHGHGHRGCSPALPHVDMQRDDVAFPVPDFSVGEAGLGALRGAMHAGVYAILWPALS